MIDPADVRDFLETMRGVYGRPEVNDRNVETWSVALASITGDELREAAFSVITDSTNIPTPAAVLAVVRDKRIARQPEPPKPDPRERVPLADGIRQIMDSLEARMRANGQRVPNRRPA